MQEGRRYDSFSRRAFILAGGQLIAFSALGLRQHHLTVVNGEQYRTRAEKNRISLRLIAPERGEIFDRNGLELAVNRPDFRVFLVPEEASDIAATLEKVSAIAPISPRRRRFVERAIARQRGFVPVTVIDRLDWPTFSRINVALPDLPGIQPDAGLTRYYTESGLFAHIIGYMGRPDEARVRVNPLYQLPGFQLGREGIEAQYEDRLRGEAGKRSVEVNAVGRTIRALPGQVAARQGDVMQLTLDTRLQRKAYSLLGEQAAGVVLLDVQTGDILAMASSPTYDANEFNTGISEVSWNNLLKDPRKPLLNKCTAGLFPPGSTFKMVVALMGLDVGLIDKNTRHVCTGKHQFGDTVFHCWKKDGHGSLDLDGAIAKSCDVYFYKMAEQMDIDELAEFARLFGLGETYDIGLEGLKSGLVPTRAWQRAVRGSEWQQGETVNVSIGQGALLATPLQLAVMTARLATGKVVKPRLILDDGEAPSFSSLGINSRHLRSVQDSMVSVMKAGGTAFQAGRSRSAPKIAGKTGTAQVRRITQAEREEGVRDNEDLPWRYRDHALFVGFSEAENPRFAVAVLVQHGGGSSVAVPIGRDLLDEAIKLERASEGGLVARDIARANSDTDAGEQP